MTEPDPVTALVDRLDARRNGTGWTAKCPAHDDRVASLSIGQGDDGRALLTCHAGCDTRTVLDAVGLRTRDLFPPRETASTGNGQRPRTVPREVAQYTYRDEDRVPVFVVVRLDPKGFRQYQLDEHGNRRGSLGDARRVLYRLDRIHAARGEGRTRLVVVEGEKDADRLAAAVEVAYPGTTVVTTSPAGAGNWEKVDDESRDAAATLFDRVLVVADNDPAGVRHAREVVADLLARNPAAEVLAKRVPGEPKADVSDLLDEHGGDAAKVFAALVDLESDEADPVWSSRPVLAHVHRFARARRANPWAVLGVVLARVVTAVGPAVTLPPIVGGHGSLNLFVALVGAASAGKGSATAAARDAVTLPPLREAGPGSGEGLAHLFASRQRGDLVRHETAVLLNVHEVDTLTALTQRRGATLLPELRKAWMGEPLGFAYADPSKRIELPEHTYRLCLVAGVQPSRAGELWGSADGGTPQRFVWLPVSDTDAPDTAPAAPDPVEWNPPTLPPVDPRTGLRPLTVCDTARHVLDRDRLATLRTDTITDDPGHTGHDGLARLKVAAALALLDGRADVTDDDWTLAGHVMARSNETRDAVLAHLARRTSAQNRRRGEQEAERAVTVAEHLADTAAQRVAGVVRRALARRDEWVSSSDVRRAVASPDRGYFDEAVDRLVDAGVVEVDDTGRGSRFRLRDGYR